MKPLSLIAFVFALFLIFLGISSGQRTGGLSNAVTVAGALILIFLAIVWAIYFVKEKKEKPNRKDSGDSL
jgi:amino acid transporter